MPGEDDPTSTSVGGSAPPNESPTVVKFVLPSDDGDHYAVANLPQTYQVPISRSSCARRRTDYIHFCDRKPPLRQLKF
jgi:hypothetical protein